jgi:hypothetical protein
MTHSIPRPSSPTSSKLQYSARTFFSPPHTVCGAVQVAFRATFAHHKSRGLLNTRPPLEVNIGFLPAAELWAGGLGPIPVASRLICYYRSRVSISLQHSQARAIHHRAAKAVQSSTGARPLSVQDGFVRSADLYTVTRVGDS